MLGDFITRGLLLVLGYAYPAFECFKTVEKNRVEIEELRFWCQYWIIVAVMTVFERFADIFISWVPMYGEMKLALIIYLWYPKTKGTGYVYEFLLRPFVSQHETDIERSLRELRVRIWDLALYYYQNCTDFGQTAFFQIFQYVASKSGRFTKFNKNESTNGPSQPSQKNDKHNPTASAPPPSPTSAPSFFLLGNRPKQPSDHHRRRPPLPPMSPGSTANRFMAQSPKSDTVQVHLHGQTEFIHAHHTHEELDLDDSSSGSSGSPDYESESGVSRGLNAARIRLRRSRGFH